jgi:hypothetical protein
MLSAPTNDRNLNNEEWSQLATRHFATLIVLSRLRDKQNHVYNPSTRIHPNSLNQLVDTAIDNDLPKHDFIVIRHHDVDHHHIHIIANRIDLETTKALRTWRDRYHAQYSCRLLEERYHLQPVKSVWEVNPAHQNSDQQRPEQIIRQAIDRECITHPTLPQLIKRLWDNHQIQAVVNYSSQGQAKGIKYGLNIQTDTGAQMVWKQGYNLGKHAYSLPKLQQKMGVKFTPQSHNLEIKWLTDWITKQAQIAQPQAENNTSDTDIQRVLPPEKSKSTPHPSGEDGAQLTESQLEIDTPASTVKPDDITTPPHQEILQGNGAQSAKRANQPRPRRGR